MSAKTLTPEQDAAKRLAERHARICPPETDADRLRRYACDPIGFCREWLGFEPTRVQRTILEAILRGKRVSVRSGRRVGKSYIMSAVALWFYCTQGRNTRVILMANTENQIREIMWRAVVNFIRTSKRPIPGRLGEKGGFDSGFTWDEQFSQIRGATARKAETIAGIAGANIMYIIDEASGVDRQIFEAVEGNLAGGNAWMLLIGNPTRNDGFFYDSHHDLSTQKLGEKHGFISLCMSSYESPNITGECGDTPISGLADPDWIEMMQLEHGDDSSWVSVHIRGEFAAIEERRLFQLGDLEASQERWKTKPGDADYVLPDGRLYIGLDPAGAGGEGDESAFVWRRGSRVLGIRREKGLSPDAHVAHALGIISEYRAAIDSKMKPAIILDMGGKIGKDVRAALVDYRDKHPEAFEVVGVELGGGARVEPRAYFDFRTELAANAARWMREGGAIPADKKLLIDLRALEYDAMKHSRAMHTHLLVLISKDKGPESIKKRIGRSPDTGDAFQLCCWEPRNLREEANERPPAQQQRAAFFDPYANQSRGGSAGRVFNPYSSLGYRSRDEE